MSELTQAYVGINVDANDIVQSLEKNDDLIFKFIMDILDHEDVGQEVIERLLEELEGNVDQPGLIDQVTGGV